VRDAPLRERLSGVKDPEEAARMIGRRRFLVYAFGFSLIALAGTSYSVYLIVSLATGETSGWTQLALPASLLVVAYFAPVSYALFYGAATGRRWSGGDAMGKVAGLLTNTDVWPRRRRRR